MFRFKLTKQIKSLYRYITSVYWQVALVKHSHPILLQNDINVLNFPVDEDNWYADPFLFDIRENEIDIIVEEYMTDIKKGVITMLTVNKSDFNVISKKRILELDTHLSFPFVFKENNKTYFFPENSASGVHTAYELSNDLRVTKIGIVVDDALVDTAIIKVDGFYFLFGTKVPEENGHNLYVYKSDTLLGKYNLFQVIAVNKATARGASGIYPLDVDNCFYRIAQDNEGFYGRGLVYQEIVFNRNVGEFSISEKYRKYPNFVDKGFVAMHTYNTMGEFAVIDVKKYKYPIWGKLVNYIRYRQ